jgi:hypothetical protein
LDDLGFDSIRAIAKIDFEMIRKIELTIQTLYTGSDVFATMCDTKKNHVLDHFSGKILVCLDYYQEMWPA